MVTHPEFPYLFAVLFGCEVEGRCSSSFLQGARSRKLGHPDVTTDDIASPHARFTGTGVAIPPEATSLVARLLPGLTPTDLHIQGNTQAGGAAHFLDEYALGGLAFAGSHLQDNFIMHLQ